MTLNINFTEEELKELAQNYYEKNKQKNKMTKEVKDLNTKIKDYLVNKGYDGKVTLDCGEYNIVQGIQNRSSVNENKLLDLLKEKGFNEAIKVIEKPDSSKVETLIYNGDISNQEYYECINEKLVKTLKVEVRK